MPKGVQDIAAARLADLPVLTTRRACVLADCSRSTLQRSGPAPVGRRGRTFVYRTADIIAWLTGGIGNDATEHDHATTRRPAPTKAAVLDRLREIARGGAK